MKNNNDHYEDGWFYGYAPELVLSGIHDDGNGRYTEHDTRNVVGRFRDIKIVDGVASREARKSIYKTVTVLESRIIAAVEGRGSDVACTRMRFFYPYTYESVANIRRFRAAWENYQSFRETPVSDEEFEALSEAGIMVEKPRTEEHVVKDTGIKVVNPTSKDGRGGRRPGAGRPRKAKTER